MWVKKYSRLLFQFLFILLCGGAALWGARNGQRWAPLLAFVIYMIAGMIILPRLPNAAADDRAQSTYLYCLGRSICWNRGCARLRFYARLSPVLVQPTPLLGYRYCSSDLGSLGVGLLMACEMDLKQSIYNRSNPSARFRPPHCKP